MRASSRCLPLVLLLALAACGFEAPPPRRTPPPPAPPPPLSTVDAALSVPADAILAALNDKTASQVARIDNAPVDCAVATCLLDLIATRTGPITGRAADGRLALELPLTATAQLALKTALFKAKASTLATGVIHARSAIALGSDWHLRTQTEGDVQLSQGELELGPIHTSFAALWNRNQQRLSAPLLAALDRHVASAIKLAPEAERLWQRLQRPIRVGKTPAAWLVLEPVSVRVAQPSIRNDALVMAMGVEARAHVVVSETPPAGAPTRALPPPAPLGAASNRFAFVVPVLLPYGEAAALAQQRLAKTPIKLAGGHVRVERLAILPSGQDVVVAARFCVTQSWDPFGWFDSCGEGYLRGTPEFDAATRTIRIARIHYDIATEDMLLAAMRWLAGDEFGKTLETKLVFGVGRDLDKLDSELKSALARPQGRGVVISGTVDSFGRPSLTWTEQGFLATFPASGTIKAELQRPLDKM